MKKLYLLILLLTANCASIINGTTQEVTINSDPAGAKLVIDNRLYEKSPVVIDVSRKKDIAGRLKKDGYEDESFIIERRFSKWAYLDFLIPPAFIFDLYTGGAYVFEKDRYYVEMEFEKKPKQEERQQEVRYNYLKYVPPKQTVVTGAPGLSTHMFDIEGAKRAPHVHKTESQKKWEADRQKHEDNIREIRELRKMVKEISKQTKTNNDKT